MFGQYRTARHIRYIPALALVKANQHLSFPNVMVLNLVGLVSQQFIAYSILQEELKSSFPISMILIIGGVFTLASIPALKKGLFYGIDLNFFLVQSASGLVKNGT